MNGAEGFFGSNCGFFDCAGPDGPASLRMTVCVERLRGLRALRMTICVEGLSGMKRVGGGVKPHFRFPLIARKAAR